MIAVTLPVFDAFTGGFQFGDAAREALLGKSDELDLDHVEPRTVLGRVMDLQAVGQSIGLGRRDGLVEAGSRVGIELVQFMRQFMRMCEEDIAH
jgi:hypothetical protein